MSQGNHWPLGSRFMTSEEFDAQTTKLSPSVEVFSMTSNALTAGVAAGVLASELAKNKQASASREIRPINWLGRP